MQLTQPLHKGLREQPGAVASVSGKHRLTFRGLHDRVARLAAGLRSLGVGAGTATRRRGLLSTSGNGSE
jgi:non-ribosomal peptide synthetase component E (peptide arylation enzyme)